jgi:hypothetical protein
MWMLSSLRFTWHGDSFRFQECLGASHVRFHFYSKENNALSEFDVHRGLLSEEKNVCVLPIVSNNYLGQTEHPKMNIIL